LVLSRESATSRRSARRLARRVGGQAAVAAKAEINASVLWLCVPDREIESVARQFASLDRWHAAGKVCFHSSGALGSEALAPLRARGVAVASVHPLMTFSGRTTASLERVPFALEGDARALRVAREIVKQVGGESFRIAEPEKKAYHAFATFISPLIVALLATAEDMGLAAGLSRASVRQKIAPILRQTVENYLRSGAAKSFTGPLVRGDAHTIAGHLDIAGEIPDASQVYVALARSALRRLPAARRHEIEQLLARSEKRPRRQ
jgi:predicted short-subunit dehydrogenase-like oxidoreductase (DUF2520 family)